MVMSDEQNKKTNDDDYRFIDYRLDQLETNLRKGQEKLLQVMQEGNNKQNEQLISLNQRLNGMEEKLKCIEKLKEVATKNTTEIKDIEKNKGFVCCFRKGIKCRRSYG